MNREAVRLVVGISGLLVGCWLALLAVTAWLDFIGLGDAPPLRAWLEGLVLVFTMMVFGGLLFWLAWWAERLRNR